MCEGPQRKDEGEAAARLWAGGAPLRAFRVEFDFSGAKTCFGFNRCNSGEIAIDT